MFAFAFPMVDPIFISVGPLAIRWYALAYLAGFVGGWRLCLRLANQNPKGILAQKYDDFLTWAILGVILGGRVGYVLFYQFSYYLSDPMEALRIWHGGMSFHGGVLGVILAAYLFTRKEKLRFFSFTDILACVTPIGLFFGRIANFINDELWGRATDVPWAVVFPRGGDIARHPSQLYEAALEGLALFVLMMLFVRRPALRDKEGFLSGVFLIGYGLFRFLVEFFREPDEQLGYLWGGATMGQLLCLPMIAFGAYLLLPKPKKEAP